jgi:two-component sensor histidine kinase
MMLAPEAAQNLGLAMHELATNAVKHGALSTPDGGISISWIVRREPGQDQRLQFTWRESGGVVAKPPRRRGFGHVVLEEIVPGMLGGAAKLAFAPEGVTWTLDVALSAVSSAATAGSQRRMPANV